MKSECCGAEVKLNNDPTPEDVKEAGGIFWFRCRKCGKPCHLKKENRT